MQASPALLACLPQQAVMAFVEDPIKLLVIGIAGQHVLAQILDIETELTDHASISGGLPLLSS